MSDPALSVQSFWCANSKALTQYLERSLLPASQRLKIYEELPKRHGRGPGLSVDEAVRQAGFASGRETYATRTVLRTGIRKLKRMMDAGDIVISTAAAIARHSADEQKELVASYLARRRPLIESTPEQKAQRRRYHMEHDTGSIRLPNGPVAASRMLWERWPEHWIRELIEALEGRLQAEAEGRRWRKPKGNGAA